MDLNKKIEEINKILLKECTDTYNEYAREYNYYIELLNEYNSYANRPLSKAEYDYSMILRNRMDQQLAEVSRVAGEADQLVETIDNENRRLAEITEEINELLT